MTDLLGKLYDHNWWAHDAIVADLRRAAPDAETLRLLAHVVAAEHLWLSRIDGVKSRVAVWPTLTLDEVVALEAENRARFRELLARPDDARLRRVQYRNSAGNDFENDVESILTHVAMHGHYHRGQIARVMRAAGREPVYTDYIGFVRKGR
ncbi:MAG TPA: DinB family protein [Gemmatimonadaceae bacterium]|nr:DinB family protein [Gemmatimonadaceae bacterium]